MSVWEMSAERRTEVGGGEGGNFLLIAQTVKLGYEKCMETSVRNTIICMAQRIEAAHATLLDTSTQDAPAVQ